MILLHAPAMPFVPEEWHGRKICAMVVCYSGDLDEAEDVLVPIRALGNPVLASIHRLAGRVEGLRSLGCGRPQVRRRRSAVGMARRPGARAGWFLARVSAALWRREGTG
jgi:hypothetical protein